MEQCLGKLLAGSPLFHGCRISEQAFSVSPCRAGQIVHDTPGGVPSIGMVVQGRVDVYSVAADGRDVWLNALHPGECFGIYNLFAERDLETVLCCAVDTAIAYLSKATLLQWMETDQRLALQYAAVCNEKLQFLIQRIEQLTTQTCRGKIAAYLLEQPCAPGEVIRTGSREALARQLGMSRAALFRELSALQACGAIAVQPKGLVICQPDRLEQMLCAKPPL